ncbi:hypothetical protein CLU85_1189 [Acidovorax sp. 69]|uniref:hypothetical protein n=1 Tax=Acidovorax sp. 69 TaxID=2035202 RepID=UPI000C240A33|nr:hypothetical protein [Acidovorax sp. 69]PJI96443.1 hypothetical protein CLU85_1189 [Acidovorax sp. 69]
MASLERRIEVLEVATRPVEPPRITVTFVSPSRGTVSARLWDGEILQRQDNGTEAQFLDRLQHIEATYDET